MVLREYEVMCMCEGKTSDGQAIYEMNPTGAGADPDRGHYNAIIQPAIALMRRANHQSQTDVKYSYRESTTNGPLFAAQKKVKLSSKPEK